MIPAALLVAFQIIATLGLVGCALAAITIRIRP